MSASLGLALQNLKSISYARKIFSIKRPLTKANWPLGIIIGRRGLSLLVKILEMLL